MANNTRTKPKSTVGQIFKMIGIFLLYWITLSVTLSLAGLDEQVEHTRIVSTTHNDSFNVDGQYDANSQVDADANDSHTVSGNGTGTETHTETETYYTEELPAKYERVCSMVAALLTLLTFLLIPYNRAQRLRAGIPEARSNICVDEEKCTQMLSQANRVVEKYQTHEADVLKAVAAARWSSDVTPNAAVTTAADFRAVVEAYPQLKANESVLRLLEQIEACETDLATQKKTLNGMVAQYNAEIHTFPLAILRKMAKLRDETPYRARDDAGVITDEMLGI